MVRRRRMVIRFEMRTDRGILYLKYRFTTPENGPR